MHEYIVERRYEQYFVYENNTGLFHARISEAALPLIPFSFETVAFYDNDGKEIITSKLYSLFGMGIFRKVRCLNGDSFKVKTQFLFTHVFYNGAKYTIKYRSKNSGDELYVNNVQAGRLFRAIEGVSNYTHSITCEEEKHCYIFSVMNILFYRFDVN